MLELRVLQYFLTVAREENITRAAAYLHITQPTLSRQLIQLEEELGVPLFHRTRQKLVLTEDGMLLRRRAQEIVALARKAEQELTHGEQLTGELAIGSGDLKSMEFLADCLSTFRQQHPLVQFRLYSGDSDNIKEQLELGLLDLGLLLEPVDVGKYEFLRLPAKECWGVLVPTDSPLAVKTAVTPADLAGCPLLSANRALVQKELTSWFGAYTPEIVGVGNLPYNLAVLARKGLGVYLTIQLDCTFHGLTFLPLSPPLERQTVLAWKKVELASPVTTAFLQQVQECLNRITAHTT